MLVGFNFEIVVESRLLKMLGVDVVGEKGDLVGGLRKGFGKIVKGRENLWIWGRMI